ncbi:Outer membrane receptor proteins, mostly Fe transport [Pricia antarctica]|uniref:Outer membrane receptor proteins, mostly Fe transport n=1 Tax=Pricia antarctica TaxID=641691 RepID=A0A1G7ANI8_9FLAO|nr:outer membrane beta-barrel family protein [Pricia antarctica]SDE16494.1 Outer membrane receptor proteins, mostly Fe transport [Pricia antarctica]
MKSGLLFFFLLCGLVINTTTVLGQNGPNGPITLTGKVMDNDTNEPLEYATLVLQSVDNPEKVTGGITDVDGIFSVETAPGNYNVRVEFISYKPYVLPQQNLTDSKDFGIIKLTVDVAQLQGVEVTGEKTTVEVRLDKKIYNIGKDLTTSGANVSDALNNVPSVTVDVDGAIALRGNSNVRILINGRPSAMAGFGSTDALRQLPADAIESVEVITSPSARYDAEGTAGILNIILKKEKTLGFNGSINSSIGFPVASQVSTNLNLRTDKFNVFTTLGYTYREPPGNAFFNNTYANGEFARIIEDRDINRKDIGFNANLGMEYFLTEKSSLSGSIFGRFSDEEDFTDNLSDRFVGTSLDSRTFRSENENQDDKSYQVSLNYMNNFNDEGHKLTADFQYSYDDETKTTPIEENRIFPDNDLLARENVYEAETQNEYLLQADYVLPMGDAQFEAGYRGKFEQEVTDYQLDTLNQNNGQFETDQNLTNQFTYDENVNALYSQYGNKFGKFSFLLGLRLENTQLKGQVASDFDATALQEILGADVDLNFDKNYLGLFPTINWIFELAEEENISLGYNRRINRPRGFFINPFPSRSSRTNVFQGNPDLDPAFANAFDLGYLKRWEKLTLTSSIYYQKETNSFEVIQEETGEITSDGIRIIRSIPINLSTNERYGAELGLLYNPAKWLRLNGSFNFFQFVTEGIFNEVDFGTKNTSWFSRFSAKVTLPGKIDWQTNAFYRGPSQTAQSENKGIFSLDLAFSKDVLGDKATVSFNVSDLLNTRKRQSLTQTAFFTSDSEFQWRERQITLGFIYRINEKKSANKKQGQNGDDEEGGYGG